MSSVSERARGFATGPRDRWIAPAVIVLGLLYPWYVEALQAIPLIGDWNGNGLDTQGVIIL